MSDLMSVSDVLKVLGITHQTLRVWDRKGILPSKRNRFGWRFFKKSAVRKIKSKINKKGASGPKLPAGFIG